MSEFPTLLATGDRHGEAGGPEILVEVADEPGTPSHACRREPSSSTRSMQGRSHSPSMGQMIMRRP
jgi:hypothetical protein